MSTVIMILTLLPLIIQTVRAVEEAAPISGAGKQKLDLILGLIEDIANTSGVKEGDKKLLLAATPVLVGRVVATMNALGVFGKPKE